MNEKDEFEAGDAAQSKIPTPEEVASLIVESSDTVVETLAQDIFEKMLESRTLDVSMHFKALGTKVEARLVGLIEAGGWDVEVKRTPVQKLGFFTLPAQIVMRVRPKGWCDDDGQ